MTDWSLHFVDAKRGLLLNHMHYTRRSSLDPLPRGTPTRTPNFSVGGRDSSTVEDRSCSFYTSYSTSYTHTTLPMNITSQLGKRKPANSPETSPLAAVGKDGGGRATPRPRKALVIGDPVESKVKSLEEARAFFVEQGQLNEDVAANTTSVLNLLFWLAVGPNKSAQFLTDGIRSAYQVLKHAQETGTIGDIHASDPRVLQELESQRASLANLENLVTKIASDNQGQMKVIRKDIEETKKGITEIKTSTTETHLSTAPNWAPPRSHRTQGPMAPSYASVASKDSAQQHLSAITRGNDRE